MMSDTIQSLLERLRSITDERSFFTLAEEEPLLLHSDVLTALENAAADPVSGLSAQHLEWLAELRRRAEHDLPSLIQALLAANDSEDLRRVADQWPMALSDAFVEIIDQLAQRFADIGQSVVAQGLRHRLVGLAQLRAQREEWSDTPQGKAVFAFLNAADDAAALAAFQAHRHLLMHPEAQHTLDHVLQGGDPESQQRLKRRRELLRVLRGEEQHQ